MDMKWHPIVNGDLSGIPINEEFLFTVFDEIADKHYVIKGLSLMDGLVDGLEAINIRCLKQPYAVVGTIKQKR